MKKFFKRFFYGIDHKRKAKELSKIKTQAEIDAIEKGKDASSIRSFNPYFIDAMNKGLFNPEPLFNCKGIDYYLPAGLNESNGTEFKILHGKFAQANLIFEQYSEYGLSKERLTTYYNRAEEAIQTAKNCIITKDWTKLEQQLTLLLGMTLSARTEVTFSNELMRELEILALILVSPYENPYHYDYNTNLAKINDWGDDYERLRPLFFSIPTWVILGLPSPSDIGSILASNQTLMESKEMDMAAVVFGMLGHQEMKSTGNNYNQNILLWRNLQVLKRISSMSLPPLNT